MQSGANWRALLRLCAASFLALSLACAAPPAPSSASMGLVRSPASSSAVVGWSPAAHQRRRAPRALPNGNSLGHRLSAPTIPIGSTEVQCGHRSQSSPALEARGGMHRSNNQFTAAASHTYLGRRCFTGVIVTCPTLPGAEGTNTSRGAPSGTASSTLPGDRAPTCSAVCTVPALLLLVGHNLDQ